MKSVLLVLVITFLSFLLLACDSKINIVWIFDDANVLTQEQISKFDSLYKSHEKETTNEIALVTTSNYYPDTSLLMFAVNFGRSHGIGKKGKDNGVVIVFNGTRQETMISTGYGTEKILRDEIVKKIIDSLMLPNFKKGKTFEGLWEGSLAIVKFLEKPENKIESK